MRACGAPAGAAARGTPLRPRLAGPRAAGRRDRKRHPLERKRDQLPRKDMQSTETNDRSRVRGVRRKRVAGRRAETRRARRRRRWRPMRRVAAPSPPSPSPGAATGSGAVGRRTVSRGRAADICSSCDARTPVQSELLQVPPNGALRARKSPDATCIPPQPTRFFIANWKRNGCVEASGRQRVKAVMLPGSGIGPKTPPPTNSPSLSQSVGSTWNQTKAPAPFARRASNTHLADSPLTCLFRSLDALTIATGVGIV